MLNFARLQVDEKQDCSIETNILQAISFFGDFIASLRKQQIIKTRIPRKCCVARIERITQRNQRHSDMINAIIVQAKKVANPEEPSNNSKRQQEYKSKM